MAPSVEITLFLNGILHKPGERVITGRFCKGTEIRYVMKYVQMVSKWSGKANGLEVYCYALLQYSYRYNRGNNTMKQCNILV